MTRFEAPVKPAVKPMEAAPAAPKPPTYRWTDATARRTPPRNEAPRPQPARSGAGRALARTIRILLVFILLVGVPLVSAYISYKLTVREAFWPIGS
jgi:hypothetical protein